MEQLVRDIAQLTGAPVPSLLGSGAATPSADALAERTEEGFYVVALVGGEGVGKTSLLAALAGNRMDAAALMGGGTQVIAYCHEMQAPLVRAMLEREVPGRVRMATHQNHRLFHQVLLDLPAVDASAEGLDVARRVLRHTLFPIWVQSIEQYADARPQALLAELAAGNDVRNFLFCLTKADEAFPPPSPGEPDPSLSTDAVELRSDYAGRVGRVLGLAHPPRVYLISAPSPLSFDLPHLTELLAQQKAHQSVNDARNRATARREKSLGTWLDEQDLPGQARRMAGLEDEARAVTGERLLSPLTDEAIPALIEDPGYQALLADDAVSARSAAFPLLAAFRGAAGRRSAHRAGAAEVVESHVPQDATAAAVRAVFQTLHESYPNVAAVYAGRRPWEGPFGDDAAAELRSRLAGAIERQRRMVRDHLARSGARRAVVPWALTIFPLLWFPFVQPLLEAAAAGELHGRGAGVFFIRLLGANHLLWSAALLALWFGAMWVWLRWDAKRRLTALQEQWRASDARGAALDLPAQARRWVDDLLGDIRAARRKVETLAERAAELRKAPKGKAAAA